MKSKRPLLLIGLSITFLLSLCYIISQIMNLFSQQQFYTTSWIILFIFCIVFILNYKALKTVDFSEKDFKKGKWYSWSVIIIFFLYDIFEYINIIRSYNKSDVVYVDNVLKIALLFITLIALLLSTLGICTKVIDNKISYNDYINKQNNTK